MSSKSSFIFSKEHPEINMDSASFGDCIFVGEDGRTTIEMRRLGMSMGNYVHSIWADPSKSVSINDILSESDLNTLIEAGMTGTFNVSLSFYMWQSIGEYSSNPDRKNPITASQWASVQERVGLTNKKIAATCLEIVNDGFNGHRWSKPFEDQLNTLAPADQRDCYTLVLALVRQKILTIVEAAE